MKRILCAVVSLFLAGSCRGEKPKMTGTQADSVRQPVFADKFYPADSTKLINATKSFLGDAKPPGMDNPVAIIVPHAGYIFSGQSPRMDTTRSDRINSTL